MGKRIPILLGFILLAFAIWAQVTHFTSVHHFITRFEDLAYDMQLLTRVYTQQKFNSNTLAIVDIDDKSISKEGRWPWNRDKIAALIGQIQQAGATVVALDILFSEKEENIANQVSAKLTQLNLMKPALVPFFQKIAPLFNNDAVLAKSFTSADTVLGFSFVPRQTVEGELAAPLLQLSPLEQSQLGFFTAPGYIGNAPLFISSAKNTGFINVFPDVDGIIRHSPVLIEYKSGLYPSLALETARVYLLEKISIVTAKYNNQLRLEGVKIGDHIIPTDSHGEVIIPFHGKSFYYPYYSATDVLHNKIPAGKFEGKIVFVGTSATGLGDLKATAIQSVYPGVEIQATIVDGILNNYFSYKPAWSLGAEIFITFALGIILTLIFPFLGPRALSLFIIAIPLAFILINDWIWEKTGLLISVFMPVIFSILLAMLNMIYGYLFETRRREKLKNMFGQYVPAKHIDEMLTSSGDYGLYGEDREMTVLFADIRNFTTLSEPLSAQQLKEMLNEFFTPITEIIFKYRGTIDKYVGDMVMAFWGAPLKDKRHAFHALNAALDMQQVVENLKPVFAAKGWHEIMIGVGLNSGIMSVGDMGSVFRRNYTVLGDAVNLASRIEQLTKFYGAKIITTENTLSKQKMFVTRKLDRVRVKGKKDVVEIYEVLCRQSDLTEALSLELANYQLALEHYFKQEWLQAKLLLAELHEAYPHAKIYKIYLERVAEFAMNPPPADWDGTHSHHV